MMLIVFMSFVANVFTVRDTDYYVWAKGSSRGERCGCQNMKQSVVVGLRRNVGEEEAFARKR